MNETFCPKNLQNLQANDIQALMMSLQALIPTETVPIESVPQREPAHHEPVS